MSKYGIWQLLPSHYVTSLLLSADIDFVLIDLEHSMFSFDEIVSCHNSALSLDKHIVVRPPSISHPFVLPLIDIGVNNLLFPHIYDPDQLKQITALYLDSDLGGNRSFSPFVRSYGYGASGVTKSNPNIGILIESVSAFENLTELVSHKSVSFIYFGAYDLSVDLGTPGDLFSPKMLDYIKSAIKLCDLYSVKLMALYNTFDDYQLLSRLGVEIFINSVDTFRFSSSINGSTFTGH